MSAQATQVGQVGQAAHVGQPQRGERFGASRTALAAVVLIHLGLSFVHGAAHSGAQVMLGPAGMLFVYVVILAGPLVGLALAVRLPRAGASTVAATMAASLVFGLINHFIIQGADHVAHVAPAWRTMFGSTAALLVAVEAAGTAIGLRGAVGVQRTS